MVAAGRHDPDMDPDRALGELLTLHAAGVRLRDARAAEALIAAALAVAVETVPALLAVAEAKLAAVWYGRAAEPESPAGSPA